MACTCCSPPQGAIEGSASQHAAYYGLRGSRNELIGPPRGTAFDPIPRRSRDSSGGAPHDHRCPRCALFGDTDERSSPPTSADCPAPARRPSRTAERGRAKSIPLSAGCRPRLHERHPARSRSGPEIARQAWAPSCSTLSLPAPISRRAREVRLSELVPPRNDSADGVRSRGESERSRPPGARRSLSGRGLAGRVAKPVIAALRPTIGVPPKVSLQARLKRSTAPCRDRSTASRTAPPASPARPARGHEALDRLAEQRGPALDAKAALPLAGLRSAIPRPEFRCRPPESRPRPVDGRRSRRGRRRGLRLQPATDDLVRTCSELAGSGGPAGQMAPRRAWRRSGCDRRPPGEPGLAQRHWPAPCRIDAQAFEGGLGDLALS